MSQRTPDISVVVGSKNAGQTIEHCLRALHAQIGGLTAQIILVDGSTDGTAELISQRFPEVQLIRADPKLLTPHLWALGIKNAKAPIVALTISQCIPSDDWISRILLVAAAQESCAAFGGPIEGPSHGSMKDWAVYFSRYSAFMPPVQPQSVIDLAGDNAAYRRVALNGFESEMASGFWENLVHHHLLVEGWKLYLSPDIRAQLGPVANVWSFCRERFRHGRYYGSTRPRASGLMRALRALTAPALMPFLLLRIGLRVTRQRRDWLANYLFSMPWSVVFLSFWSLGEMSGYLWPQRSQ